MELGRLASLYRQHLQKEGPNSCINLTQLTPSLTFAFASELILSRAKIEPHYIFKGKT